MADRKWANVPNDSQTNVPDVDALPAPTSTNTKGRQNLRPFRAGEQRTKDIAAQGVAARRQRRAAQRARTEDIAADLASVVASHDRGSLGNVAASAALDMIGRVVRGEQSVRDPADWVRVLVDVARIEEGQHTSAAVVAHLNGNDAAQRVAALQSSARQALALVDGSAITTGMADQEGTEGQADGLGVVDGLGVDGLGVDPPS